MKLEKHVLRAGDGVTFPTIGEAIQVRFVGWLYDETTKQRGRQLDTLYKQAPINIRLGVGHVVKGCEILLTQMSLGEKSILNVPSDFAYGSTGLPERIPPSTDLIFEVELLRIGDKTR